MCWRSTTSAAPKIPNTAPDAPTVGVSGRHEKRAGRARERGRDVEAEEAPVTEVALEDAAEPPEREHVEDEVEQPCVEERAGAEPPPFARRDEWPEEGSLLVSVPPMSLDPAPRCHLARNTVTLSVIRAIVIAPGEPVAAASASAGAARFGPVGTPAHSGQRIPTGPKTMQSVQIGPPAVEQLTAVSTRGCR